MPMPYVTAIFIFLTITTLGSGLTSKSKKEKIDLSERLGQLKKDDESMDIRRVELERRTISQRVLKPVASKLSGIVGKVLPLSMMKSLEPLLIKAGNPGNFSASEIVVYKVILAIIPALGMIFLEVSVPVVVLVVIISWLIPDIYLKRRIKQRKNEIENSLPDILDLITVSVEAGLGFDGALNKVSEKSSGLLAIEFKKLLKEIRMGKSRREALKDLTARVDSEDLTTLVGAIIQADQLGISFSKMFRLQSEEMRYKRKQRAEEAAMKAPVKMLIPLVLFIFPTIFVVLLGPAAIRIMKAFM